MTRLLLGTLVVCLMFAAGPGAVSAMSPVGTLICNTCTLAQQIGAPFPVIAYDTASYDTVVVNWIQVDALDADTTATAGETAWLTFSVTNQAGLPDTVTMAAISQLGWNTRLYDSVGVAVLAPTQQLAAQQTLQFKVAVWKPGGASGITDSVSVGAVSTATATAADSAAGTIQRTSLLHHFTVAVPPAIYAGVPFGITVTAFDRNGDTVIDYDTPVTVALKDPLFADTGTVSPAVLAGVDWSGGVWAHNLTVSNCVDTVYLVFQVGDVTETRALRSVSYLVMLDKAVYQGLTDPIHITVNDARQDSTALADQVRVQVVSDADAAGITVVLTETGLTTGIFAGSVRFTQGATQPDAIRVNSNGNVTVTYDPDGAGGTPAVTVQVSWLALVIGDLESVRSWPNPFRAGRDREIVIHQLPSDPGMVIEIYNTAAQRIRTLRVGEEIAVTPQENVARWDGCSESGGAVASGTYVYVVKSAAGTVVRKLTIIR